MSLVLLTKVYLFIEKVVMLLEELGKEIEAERDEQAKLHEKFQCICKTEIPSMSKEIEEAQSTISALQSTIAL